MSSPDVDPDKEGREPGHTLGPSRLVNSRADWGSMSTFGTFRWLPLLVPLALLAWTTHAVFLAYSPTPFVDQWATYWEYREVLANGITLKYLLSQHNEHRILFPRLLFLVDLHWLSGRNIINLVVIGLIQLLGAAFYINVARSPRPGLLRVLGLAVALGLMVSLGQWENLFWGFQVQFVGVYVAGAWSIYLFLRSDADPDHPRLRLIGAALLLVVATFTMANGVFAGLAAFAVALATGRRVRTWLTAGLLTLILVAIYLHGYHPIAEHSPPSLALAHPADFLSYVLMYLGNVWLLARHWHAVTAGLLGVGLTLAMITVTLRSARNDVARSTLLAIALFIAIGAAATALGRLSFGIGQSLSSRYVTPTGHFWAAQALFWAITAEAKGSGRFKLLSATALMLALLLLLPVQVLGRQGLLNTRERVLLGSSALIGGAKDADAIGGLYTVDGVRDLYPFMRQQRLSIFADDAGPAIGSAFHPVLAPSDRCRGSFDEVKPATDKSAFERAYGWSWDNVARAPFARVILTDSGGRVIGIGFSGLGRPDVRDALHSRRALYAGWISSAPATPGLTSAYGMLQDGHACFVGQKAAT
jgi:hypothetical protein